MTEETKAPEVELQEINHEGTPIKIGQREFILPPLPVTKLVKLGFYQLQKSFLQAQKSEDVETIGELSLKLLELVYQALLMNYPNLTREESVELLHTKKLYELIAYLIDTKEGLEQAKNA